jgi:tol-pal system protein YbgF
MPRSAIRLKRSVLPAFALGLLLSGGTAALAQEPGGLFGSLFGGSDRARTERAAPAADSPVVMAQMSGPDLVVRLERLENQIRQLTGTIEQLQFRNQQLEQQLRRSQEDIEYRFQELGGKAPPRPRAAHPSVQPPPAAAPAQPAAPAPDPRRRSDVFDPREDPDAPGAPRVLGAASPSGGPPPIAVEEPDIGAPGGRQAGAPLDLSTLAARAASDPTLAPDISVAPPQPPAVAGPLPPPPPSNPNATGAQRMVMAPTNSPKEEFAVAHAFIQQKDYAMAESAFREFLKKHPGDRLAPDAHYWLGESLFQRQRYRDAAESFLAVSTKHEKSAKAPEALLRLGQSLAALGEKEASCATFAEVPRKFPKATAVKQGAEREQKRGRC